MVVLGAGSSFSADSVALVTASGPVKLSVSILATYSTLQAEIPKQTDKQAHIDNIKD